MRSASPAMMKPLLGRPFPCRLAFVKLQSARRRNVEYPLDPEHVR